MLGLGEEKPARDGDAREVREHGECRERVAERQREQHQRQPVAERSAIMRSLAACLRPTTKTNSRSR